MQFASPSCRNPRRGYGAGEYAIVQQTEAKFSEFERIRRKRIRAQFSKQELRRLEERERIEEQERFEQQAALEHEGEERERQDQCFLAPFLCRVVAQPFLFVRRRQQQPGALAEWR
jgi:hypothetical protein